MVDKTKIMLSQLQTEVELKSELSLAIMSDAKYSEDKNYHSQGMRQSPVI